MKTYHKIFGVADWDGDNKSSESGDKITEDEFSPGTSTESSRPVAFVEREERPRRLRKVRSRCTAQSKALSSWWKLAIQTNIQRRMWVRVGRSPIDSFLPPRFERIYQPEKMAQFDRFFSRSWATPVRRSHASQHMEDHGDKNAPLDYYRDISGRVVSSPSTIEREFENMNRFMGNMLAMYDAAHGEPHLRSLLEQFSKGEQRSGKLVASLGEDYVGHVL